MLLNIYKKIASKPEQRIWIRLTIISWILAVICIFITTVLLWIMVNPLDPSNNIDWILWLAVIPVILALLITGLPLFIAFFRPDFRTKLYTSPTIGATSLFILSLLLSAIILVGIEAICRVMEIDSLFYTRESSPDSFWGEILMAILTGFFIGIIAFPLTFGLVFPFAIPIACAMGVWSIIDKHQRISVKAWSLFMVGAILGWMLVAVVGYTLGHA